MLNGSCSIIGTRKWNEDFHLYAKIENSCLNIDLIAVFDGHGGHEAS
jgi:serine/threonine protein phosphatase PrpC